MAEELKRSEEAPRCTANEREGFYWGADFIDPSEPDFVEGKGIWIPQASRCVFAANRSTGLCTKHEFLAHQRERG